jgi:hypothetical protein
MPIAILRVVRGRLCATMAIGGLVVGVLFTGCGGGTVSPSSMPGFKSTASTTALPNAGSVASSSTSSTSGAATPSSGGPSLEPGFASATLCSAASLASAVNGALDQYLGAGVTLSCTPSGGGSADEWDAQFVDGRTAGPGPFTIEIENLSSDGGTAPEISTYSKGGGGGGYSTQQPIQGGPTFFGSQAGLLITFLGSEWSIQVLDAANENGPSDGISPTQEAAAFATIAAATEQVAFGN